MIPLIGYMIGAYILVRMLEIILNKETHGAVAISAFLTFALVCLCLIGLFFNEYKGKTDNFGLGIIGPMFGNNSSIPTGDTRTTTAGSSVSDTPENVVSTPPPKPEWSYSNNSDAVSSKEIKQANMTSLNSFEMEFPYQGGTYGGISIRKHPRYGKDIMFTVNKGQLLCRSYDGCQVSVKFDNNAPFEVHAGVPEDNSSTVLFLRGYDKLLKKIKTSKTMIVEVTFHQNGSKAFEFDVSNLNFE